VRRHGATIAAAVAATVLLVDQLTKLLVRADLSPAGTSVPVIGNLLRLTFTRNEGAAFGMLAGGRALFIPVHIIVLVCIAGYVIRRRPERPWLIVALGLVAGGALGNLVDRAVLGFVTDFIQIPFDFPVFNIADSAIVVGVAMLVWWLLFGPAPVEPAVAECEASAPSDEVTS
jgi:signal peptidase II